MAASTLTGAAELLYPSELPSRDRAALEARVVDGEPVSILAVSCRQCAALSVRGHCLEGLPRHPLDRQHECHRIRFILQPPAKRPAFDACAVDKLIRHHRQAARFALNPQDRRFAHLRVELLQELRTRHGLGRLPACETITPQQRPQQERRHADC